MSPKSLRLSQESKIILEITINNMMHRKVLKNMIIELRSPKKWRNLVNLGQKEYGILKYQRRPTSNRRCISTIPWKTLQILISKMECYKRCWLTLYVQKASTKSDAIVVQERETSAQLTQVDNPQTTRDEKTRNSYIGRFQDHTIDFASATDERVLEVTILSKIQQMMGDLQCEPENFTDRIIFISMFNDIVWDAKGHDQLCVNNSETIQEYAERFPRGHWSFLRSGSEE